MSAVLESVLAAAYPERKAAADAADPPPLPAWPRLTDAERAATLRTMMTFGGPFASRLAEAWRRADAINAARLGQAFCDLVHTFGPGSASYAAQKRLDAFPALPAEEMTPEERSADAAEDFAVLERKERAAGLL